MKTPREILKLWVELFNQADAEQISALYHEDATNHQTMFAPIVGRESIKGVFQEEFSKAKMNCIIENIFCDGEWAILEWKDPKGLRGCGFFQILDGKIKLQRGYWDRLSFQQLYGKALR